MEIISLLLGLLGFIITFFILISLLKKVDIDFYNLMPSSKKIKSHADTNQKKINIFISYRRNDSADIVGRIYEKLNEKLSGNFYIFKDVYSIPLGVDFRDCISSFISESDIVLAVIGEKWLLHKQLNKNSEIDYVVFEISLALKLKKPIIPLFVHGANFPENSLLPLEISQLNYNNGLAIRRDPDFNYDIDRLVFGLKALSNK